MPQEDALPHGLYDIVLYEPAIPWTALALGALALLLLAAVFYYLWRRQQKQQVEAPREDSKALLLDELNALAPPALPTKERAAQYYYELGFTFRRLIEECCGFAATDLTQRELVKPLRAHVTLDREEVEAMIHFFRQGDLIKFAEETVSRAEAQAAHEQVCAWARQLVARAQRVEGALP